MRRLIAQPDIDSVEWDCFRRMFVTAVRTPVVGQTVHKVGRTTGHTTGQNTQTCVDSGVKDTDVVLLCQARMSLHAERGDSGSPVFATVSCSVFGQKATCAQVYGLLWGGLDTSTIFSPTANSTRRFNELDSIVVTCDPTVQVC